MMIRILKGDEVCYRKIPKISPSKSSSPHSYLFTSVTGLIGVHCTKVWHKTYPICDAPLSRSAGPAQLRPVTEIALPQPFLCVNRSPFRYDFGGGAKSIGYSVILNTAEIINQLLT